MHLYAKTFEEITSNGWKCKKCGNACEVKLLLTRCERLEEALRFYADKANYSQTHEYEGISFTTTASIILDDEGARARVALEGGKK